VARRQGAASRARVLNAGRHQSEWQLCQHADTDVRTSCVLNAGRHQSEWQLLESGPPAPVSGVLNAGRHQSEWQSRPEFKDLDGSLTCSTPVGIKASGRRSGRIQPRPSMWCPTPVGIKASGRCWGVLLDLDEIFAVPNAGRHQSEWQFFRGPRLEVVTHVPNAGRHQSEWQRPNRANP